LDITTFWDLIERTSHVSLGSGEEQAKLLINELTKMSEEDILSYQEVFRQQMQRAYTSDLWEAAYILNCGCSDDCFADFRAWLIAQGWTIFETVINDPENLVQIVERPSTTQDGGSLIGVAYDAFNTKTGQDMPPIRGGSSVTLIGEKLTSDLNILSRKFPKLYAKFGDCKELMDFLEI